MSGEEKFRMLAVLVVAVSLLAATTSSAVPGPTFRSRTGMIAFAGNREGHFEIYLMNVDGSGERKLPTTSSGGNRPNWSPDGSRLVFDSGIRQGPPTNANIYTINVDGTGLTQLTDTAGGNFLADWSPDGSKIAFISGRDGNADLYVMNADGSNQTRLTNTTVRHAAPAWSPDGSRIAFHAGDATGTFFNIFTIRPDGSDLLQLTNSPTTDGFADWSVHRGEIIFDSDRDKSPSDPGCFGDFDIFTMTSHGSRIRNLTKNPSTNAWPEWSPDGSHIVFGSDRRNLCNFQIYSMDSHGLNVTELTNDPGVNWFPAYQPRCARHCRH